MKSNLQDFGLSILGIEMGISIAAGFLIGYWVDGRWHTEPWGIIVGFIFGVGGAGRSLWKAVKRIEKQEQATKDKSGDEE
ncbi:AtpZ/AtpI family protein [Myxococcota bacterium]|nr:AtpZ/AtpI family protein [Myxococcota bacterium]MBU1383081.1 AtpZ/AtpI family protein [Myxococcota bacterium]MBU1498254.1 AtpZ/AtpI family protein [Myxococcota bacterium]